MSKVFPIRALFLDIGGVLLSNGWPTAAREAAAEKFRIPFDDFNNRHKLVFETFEIGKLTLKEYLDLVVFDRRRKFGHDEFAEFMFQQSVQTPEMFKFFKHLQMLKTKYDLKVLSVNNEALELNEYRIHTYELDHLIDFFVSSCYLHTRKPDLEIFRFAIGAAQVPPEQIAYIDDQGMFTELAEELGLNGVHHVDEASTIKNLAELGLK